MGTINMNKKELALASQFMIHYSNRLAGSRCNDWKFPEDWTEQERYDFVKEFWEFNGTPEVFNPKDLTLDNVMVTSLLAEKLYKMLDNK